MRDERNTLAPFTQWYEQSDIDPEYDPTQSTPNKNTVLTNPGRKKRKKRSSRSIEKNRREERKKKALQSFKERISLRRFRA